MPQAIPIYAQEPNRESAEDQTGTPLPADNDVLERPADILTFATHLSHLSMESGKDAATSTLWRGGKSAGSGTAAAFSLVENINDPSKSFMARGSPEGTIYHSSYQVAINNTSDIDKIESQAPRESRFIKWVDPKENATSTFIPEGWVADLQIIRPYKSMTGFVFFARGNENTLVYVFQPFMPLYVLPSTSLCEAENICFSSVISAEKVREMSLGNAPISVSSFKPPEQYFTSEILPMLRRNLNEYTINSTESIYASAYGSGNSSDLMPAYDIDYNFNVENKKISGKAMVFTRNYPTNSSDGTGIWDGFIVGVESSENNFEKTFQQAAVTLLNLQFEDKWLNSEGNVLLENANTSHALGIIPELMANSTLNDFNLIVPTAAHHLVKSYNNTLVAEYLDKISGKVLHLPLFPEMQYWYLTNGDQLVGLDSRRDIGLNASSIRPIF